MTTYDAFISYSHAKDKAVAAVLQSVIQTLGKPWYKLRALRVFRDDTSLSATPHLWLSIEQALNQSRHLILLTSPEAAASVWVAKEVEYWLQHRSIDTLLIGVTDGELRWDETAGDFTGDAAVPLPAVLRGRFAAEPKWVDLRAFRAGATRRDIRLMELAADFAAVVRKIPKEDLLSQEVRQQRRALTLAWSAAACLSVLVALATWQWREAVAQRSRAESTLLAATRNANDFVLKVATRLRQTVGIPIDLVRDVLARAQELQDELIKSNERDPNLQRSRAIALREVSQTLLSQGDTKAALDEAVRSRAIMTQLIGGGSSSPELRHEMSLSLNRVGEALSRAGRAEEALDAFQQSLSIRKELADATPDNEIKRALALSYERVGDALFDLARREQALEAYRMSVSVREDLAASAPGNLDAQATLAVSYDRIGRSARDDPARALEAYRKSLAIREKLVAADPRNALWQRDLAASYDNIGTILLGFGERPDALELYRRAMTTREALANGDNGNPQWRILLVISLVKLAEAGDDAIANYQRALTLVQRLEHEGKLAATQTGWRAEIESRLSKLSTSNN